MHSALSSELPRSLTILDKILRRSSTHVAGRVVLGSTVDIDRDLTVIEDIGVGDIGIEIRDIKLVRGIRLPGAVQVLLLLKMALLFSMSHKLYFPGFRSSRTSQIGCKLNSLRDSNPFT